MMVMFVDIMVYTWWLYFPIQWCTHDGYIPLYNGVHMIVPISMILPILTNILHVSYSSYQELW